jgi:hypothetical protein
LTLSISNGCGILVRASIVPNSPWEKVLKRCAFDAVLTLYT